MASNKRLFTVNGKPFYPLGRHRIYMGGYSVRDEAEIEANLKAAKLKRQYRLPGDFLGPA